MKRILLFFGLLLVLGSCVQNRKYVYLQKNDLNNRDGKPADSVAVREYEIKPFDYKVQIQDNLSVRFESLSPEEFDFLSKNQPATIMGNPQTAFLYGELVDDKGYIDYPVIGKVHVEGMTIFEIEEKLQGLANEFLQSPKVHVRLFNFRATVLGEVFREGVVPMTNNRVSLIEAIGLAGGLGELADRANIKIIRTHNGNAKVYYVNLLDENFLTSPLYYVHQNDIIVVPALKQRAFRRYFGPNLAIIVSSVTLLLLAVNLTK